MVKGTIWSVRNEIGPNPQLLVPGGFRKLQTIKKSKKKKKKISSSNWYLRLMLIKFLYIMALIEKCNIKMA